MTTLAELDRIAINVKSRRLLNQLLEENPEPSDREIRHGLEGNLCRCTGYQNIVRAVQSAAAEMRGG